MRGRALELRPARRLGLALRVGRFIVEPSDPGDLTRWRRRERQEYAARTSRPRPDLPLGISAFYEVLGVFGMMTAVELPLGV